MNEASQSPQFQVQERRGITVYIKNLKNVRLLKNYGQIYYVSKKMKYVILYVNEEKLEEVLENLNKQNFVKKIQRSYKGEVKTDYTKGES